MKLRNRLTVVLLLLSVTPVLLVWVIETMHGRKMLEEQIGTSAVELARQTLDRINEYVYSEYRRIPGWGVPIKSTDFDGGDAQATISRHLAEMVKVHEGYSYATLRDASGKVIAASNEQLIGRPAQDEETFARVFRGEPVIRGPYLDPLAEKYVLAICVPVRDGQDSRIFGVLCAALEWQNINEMVVSITAHGQKQTLAEHVMLINHEGLVISCRPPDELFAINLAKMGMQSAIRAAKHREGYITEKNEHGLTAFSAYTYQRKYRDMPLLDWHMIIHHDANRAFAPVHSLQRTVLYVLAGVLVALLVASILLARQISKPILQIASAARKVSEGDLDVKVSITSRSELGTLADSFNQMVSRLSEAQDRLRLVRRKLARAKYDEQQRLARELHDSVGQEIVALKMMLSKLEESLDSISGAEAHASLVASREHCAELLRSVRAACHELYPPVLGTLGLAASLRQLATQCGADMSGVSAECDQDLKERRFDKDVEIAAYRIAQEALSNALQHSDAGHITLQLGWQNGSVHLTVTDDGKGFEPSSVDNGAGLTIMRDRAEALSGSLSITSRPGQTIVAFRLPQADH